MFKTIQLGLIGLLIGLAFAAQAQAPLFSDESPDALQTGAGVIHQIADLLHISG
ncbi:hypothetical protein [Sulfitobacter sp. JL08]|jgi:hypothetical protein|uniref:hypothetical protein n=1 Tax=Sulfitobacter sp. JL08 TaxID=2070369 RepID=UPI0013B377ED|nr:hypothetical protein [Sulfitobacter sp. JL08]